MRAELFQEGRNCWTRERADRLAFLIDASTYFEAFARAAEKAQRSILITAWDIDGRIRLRRDRPAETLREFLYRLLDKKPALEIFILTWKFILLYSRDRELLPWKDRVWQAHPRLHFVWDGCHPFCACHHQKIVVIDDQLAFSGGLDFTDERWDTPDHRPNDRRKHPLNHSSYNPFHDMMALMEGPVAARLADLFRERWHRVGSPKPVPPPWPAPIGPSRWPEGVPIEMANARVAVARTEPAFRGRPSVREVEQLYEDAILAADHLIYFENQYFTATRIAAALGRRLREPDGPEIILILPRGCTGRLEEATLGVLRWRTIRRLRLLDRHRRFHVYYPDVAGLASGHYLKVHSKFMIVDDQFARVGSANLCNRSMAVDTECDVALEAPAGSVLESNVRSLRRRLLGEHLGMRPEAVARAEQAAGSIAEMIRRHSSPERRLVPFNGEVSRFFQALMPRRLPVDLRRPLEAPVSLTWLRDR